VLPSISRSGIANEWKAFLSRIYILSRIIPIMLVIGVLNLPAWSQHWQSRTAAFLAIRITQRTWLHSIVNIRLPPLQTASADGGLRCKRRLKSAKPIVKQCTIASAEVQSVSGPGEGPVTVQEPVKAPPEPKGADIVKRILFPPNQKRRGRHKSLRFGAAAGAENSQCGGSTGVAAQQYVRVSNDAMRAIAVAGHRLSESEPSFSGWQIVSATLSGNETHGLYTMRELAGEHLVWLTAMILPTGWAFRFVGNTSIDCVSPARDTYQLMFSIEL